MGIAIDLSHVIVSALVIGAVIFLLHRVEAYETATRGKRSAIAFAVVFVVMFVLNLLWPYGA